MAIWLPAPSFGHSLCFKYPNGSCEPILSIYIPRALPWIKDVFNPMNFDPWNFPPRIQESIRTPIPKVGVHLGVWGFIPSHSLTLLRTWNVTPRLHSWPTFLQALYLGRELKVRVTTSFLFRFFKKNYIF